MPFVWHLFLLVCHSYTIRLSFVCIHVCYSHVSECDSYLTRMYSCFICMLLISARMSCCATRIYTFVMVWYSYVLICRGMSLVCTRMSSVCHSYVLVCHPYVTSIWYIIRMSLVYDISSACHSYVLMCHLYVIRLYSYVIRMSLVCGFTRNHHLSFTSKLSWNVL